MKKEKITKKTTSKKSKKVISLKKVESNYFLKDYCDNTITILENMNLNYKDLEQIDIFKEELEKLMIKNHFFPSSIKFDAPNPFFNTFGSKIKLEDIKFVDSNERKILHNMARCKICGVTIESKHTHDYVVCKCGAIAVDGGKDYIRRVGDVENVIELSTYCK